MGIPPIIQNAIRVFLIALFARAAYKIRLYAIEEYGLIIHEFDPWFNFRATQYLADNGWTAFFHWYDHMSWYPLGRPVGSTIYPGMQITAVALWRLLEKVGYPMSLNDVCCYVPAWFGVIASLLLGLLTYETCGSANAAVLATGIMAIIPAHIMRSVGGGFDNESVAMTAMLLTFLLWCRAVRNSGSWPWGAAAGVAYIYMVAVWGGYVFVLNLIGLHAFLLAVRKTIANEDMSGLHRAYTLFYIIGTAGAIQVPVVGWAPLKSLEQLGPFFICVLIQILTAIDYVRVQKQLNTTQTNELRLKVFGGTVLAGFLIVVLVAPTGYFGPLSSRVRGLFVRHTRTGNPLVDSVAEHQPASTDAYYQNLHFVFYLAPIGFAVLCSSRPMRDSSIFMILFGLVTYYFSSKMSRLIILLGPIASALGGVGLAALASWSFDQVVAESKEYLQSPEEAKADESAKEKKLKQLNKLATGPKKSKKDRSVIAEWKETYNAPHTRTLRAIAGALFFLTLPITVPTFYTYAHRMAQAMSHPSLLFKANVGGEVIIVDDYRQAYWWLRDNTPADSRVMAWWDYGYQITGIANRTSIADGNTWNHEHIATLARCLVSNENDGHKIIRHLADYVLIWTGGGGDDLAKSIHMARIGNSVYKDICPNDPICSKFGMTAAGPTAQMAQSLLYKLHSNGQNGVAVNSTLYQHVFTSKYGKVKIYKVLRVSKKSKQWAADPANRECDAPGSWYCPGKYPPAIDFVLREKKAFKQLEDFNTAEDAEAKEYHKQYMKNMHGGQ